MTIELGQHLARAIERANDASVPLAARYRDQCTVWTDLCDDPSWLTTRSLGQTDGRRYANQLEVGQLQAFLTTGLRSLGVPEPLRHAFADELVQAFRALQRPGWRRGRPPATTVVLANAVGALRGQVCTLAEVLSQATATGAAPVGSPGPRLRVIATGLLGVLAWMASVNAADILPNLTSELDAAAFLAAELIRVTGGQTAELTQALVDGVGMRDALLQVVRGRHVAPEAEQEGGMTF